MSAESPRSWGLNSLYPYALGWDHVADSIGLERKGLKSDSWVDQAVAVGPALLSEAYRFLMGLSPEYQQILRDEEQSKQLQCQPAKPQQSQPVKRKAASIESGVAVQLALPI
jgi:hypothetical protein